MCSQKIIDTEKFIDLKRENVFFFYLYITCVDALASQYFCYSHIPEVDWFANSM